MSTTLVKEKKSSRLAEHVCHVVVLLVCRVSEKNDPQAKPSS